MELQQRQNRITTLFVLLSLLLHLLLLLIPKENLFPISAKPEPVYVEVRPPQPRERELDLPVRPEIEKPRDKPAKRLGPADQVVEREMAPEGQDTEDRPQANKTPQMHPQPQPQVQRQVARQDSSKETRREPDLRISREADRSQATRTEQPARSLPDLQTLTDISPNALAKLENTWRQKYREDVTPGDTVWMDTEADLLSSFLRRFRDYIYGVWNYPAAAAEHRQQGTCLLKITVDRQGNVLDVQLLESSGYRTLDEEAMRAVRAGASYGPLPRAYENPDLKIMAFFQYRLSNIHRVRRRAGDIY